VLEKCNQNPQFLPSNPGTCPTVIQTIKEIT
jgi:hypothetical protein